MKKIVFTVLLFSAQGVFAQKSVAPENVKTAFAKAYPGIKDVKWEKEDGNYEASFKKEGNDVSVIYSPKAIMLESEIEISPSALLPGIQSYMALHYKLMPIKGAAKITKANGTIEYEAAIKGKDILFDSNGKFIKEDKD